MKKGFTLAEVLITLSVVAVVALMTVPSIIKNYKYKTYAATLKQTIAQLNDAVQTSMLDENATSFIQSTGGLSNDCTAGKETGPCYLFNKYLKIKLNCSDSNDQRCMASSYKTLSGETRPMWGANRCAKIPNGATVCMVYNNWGMDSITHVAIDVNGPAQPNIIGIDLFTGRIDKNNGQIVDRTTDGTYCGKLHGADNHVNDYALGCIARVMENGWVIKDY